MAPAEHEAATLTGKVALVTGAAQGIGRATAERLARDGARVAVNDLRDDDRLAEVVRATGGVAAAADVSDPDAVLAMVADVEARLGPVDVLVANHAHMTMAPMAEHDLSQWWRVVDTNLGGTFWLVQAVLPGMRRTGAGRIVVISSEWGVTGWPGATAYAASKAGLISLVKTLGRELAPEGIVVNAIAPGVIDTPQLQVDADEAGLALTDMHARYAGSIPLGRLGRPAEIAATVSFLAEQASATLVGQVVQVNGGSTRSRA
jgi:NAD(P)-dependent dehydrogenase (short-subunit alcohol dehydrogenase family)